MSNQKIRKKRAYGAFLLECFYWFVVLGVIYVNIFLLEIQGSVTLVTILKLMAFVLVLDLIHIRMVIRWKRSMGTAVAGVLIPMAVYTFVTYGRIHRRAMLLLLLISVAVEALAVCVAWRKKVSCSEPEKVRKIRFRRSYKTFLNVGMVASILLLAYVGKVEFLGSEQPAAMVETGGGLVYSDADSLANNMDTVLLLEQEKWEQLDVEERLAVLKVICDIEGRYLGLNKRVRLAVSAEMPADTKGAYSDKRSTVWVNQDYLMVDISEKTVNTVCHEMFHAAQHQYVNIYNSLSAEDRESYFLQEAAVYAAEFDNYQSTSMGSEYEDYYTQAVEKAARRYAISATDAYFEAIGKYYESRSEE